MLETAACFGGLGRQGLRFGSAGQLRDGEGDFLLHVGGGGQVADCLCLLV